MNPSDLFELSRELTRLRQPHAWITVIAVNGPSSAYVGAQAIVKPDGGIALQQESIVDECHAILFRRA